MSTRHATRVVVSYPDALSKWGRDQVETPRYKGFLRRVVDDLSVGREFEEFVDVGCCGDSLDIRFRIESVEGGDDMGPDTEIEFTTREADHEGGWRVQSAAGPNAESGRRPSSERSSDR
jgi:hypothetical protein